MVLEQSDDCHQSPDKWALWLKAADPDTPGTALDELAKDASIALLERIAEHPNTPEHLLTKLSAHPDLDVRSAVSDNANATAEVIAVLCRDESPDVRFRIAENHRMSPNVLSMLALDDNPYVAERAKRTLQRLESPLQPVVSAGDGQGPVLAQQTRPVAAGRSKRLTILAIEDNPADTRLLEKMLAKWPFDVQCVDRLSKAQARLATGEIDLILLDLSLPDAQGLDCFYQVRCLVPHIPVVVLTGLEDESVGSQAVQAGAQDYLVKGQVSSGLLGRSVKYAVERHRAEARLRELNNSLERRVIQLATVNQELEKLAQALALSNEQALQASNFKSQFVARVSHDIRTPITGILGITGYLLQDDSHCSEETKELVALIDESAQSQLTLLTEVLDLAKIEAGEVKLENDDFCPVALLEDIAELFAASATKKGLSLMTYIDAALQPVLHGDRVRLREILLNLTNNAIKFTAQGDVVLRVTRECEDDDYVTARFSVSDSGIGLSDADSKHLFKPFVQLHKSPDYQGAGLGLSICKRLVDLMAGRIGAESRPGKGSTFWFSVRLKRTKNAKITGGRVLPVPSASLPNVRVLIVEQNSTAREIIQRYVHAAGWRSNGTAANASEALDMLRYAEANNDPFSVAVIDLAAKSDSFDLAATIQQDPSISATRLIFLTDFDQRRKGEQAWSAGFSAYLTKPVKQWNLLDCIAKVVGVPSKAPSKEKRILVAEDDQTMRKVLVQQLEKLGVQVDAVANGRQVLEAVSRADYDVILMDCQMPEMTGLEVTRAIRKLQANSRHTPIVAVTAGGAGQDRKDCIAAGMDEYLIKPVPLDKLREVVTRWLLIEQQV